MDEIRIETIPVFLGFTFTFTVKFYYSEFGTDKRLRSRQSQLVWPKVWQLQHYKFSQLGCRSLFDEVDLTGGLASLIGGSATIHA